MNMTFENLDNNDISALTCGSGKGQMNRLYYVLVMVI